MNAPILLAIDTSGPRLQLALAKGGGVDTCVEQVAKGHAELIFERIARLLARTETGYADLRRVAVTTGPGSFTGLRIGLSVARGLGLVLNVPVIGVPTLRATAMPLLGTGDIAIIADARRGEAYFELFARTGISERGAMIMTQDAAEAEIPANATILRHMTPDIAALARFAQTADPAQYPPVPAYIRAADAKPQQKARVARVSEAAT